MSDQKLPNYLRAWRRRTGLCQEDIAYLLGFHSAHVSRFERFRRTPGFRIAMAFEVIFGTAVRELFSGDYQKVERVIRQRARRLAKRIAKEKQSRYAMRRLEHLKKIISAGDSRK